MMKIHLVASHDSHLALCGMDATPSNHVGSICPEQLHSLRSGDLCRDCLNVCAGVGLELVRASNKYVRHWVCNSTIDPNDVKPA